MNNNKKFLDEIRCALADYLRSEGCGCCRNYENHDESLIRLGKLLKIKKYSDDSGYDSGYDFGKYESKKNNK